MHFTGLACTNFSNKTKNAKIAKFGVPLNFVTLIKVITYHYTSQLCTALYHLQSLVRKQNDM